MTEAAQRSVLRETAGKIPGGALASLFVEQNVKQTDAPDETGGEIDAENVEHHAQKSNAESSSAAVAEICSSAHGFLLFRQRAAVK